MTMIRLPWPPTATSSNKSKPGNWWEKSKAGASYKAICADECRKQHVPKLLSDGDIPVEITYYPPSLRRIDWDNMGNRCKQGWDAVSDAIGIDDGKWWPVTSHKGHKVKGGCIVVRFSATECTVNIPVIGEVS